MKKMEKYFKNVTKQTRVQGVKNIVGIKSEKKKEKRG